MQVRPRGHFRVRGPVDRYHRFMAKMSCDVVGGGQPGDNSRSWSPRTYPLPDPALEEQRPTAIATERLLWRSDGSLCAAVGRPYAIEDRPLLMTQDEWIAEAKRANK